MDDAKVKAVSEEYGVRVERIREIEAMALDRLASLSPWSSWPPVRPPLEVPQFLGHKNSRTPVNKG